MADDTRLSRRRFLQFTGAMTGAAATLGLAGAAAATSEAAPAAAAKPETAPAPHAEHAADAARPLHRGRMFFTNDTEFSTLSDAAERIFPKDETGPGAKELAVPYFIDNQLAGAYGYNAREYTGGPHFAGAPSQGYQTSLVRRDVFKQGLLALNNAAQERFAKDFSRLEAAEQDQILKDCEAGKLPTRGFTSGYFFSLLKDAVLAGAYADPLYNGNNNMDGWRMKHYPGAQMAYVYLMMNETFEEVAPVSLSSMQ